MTKYQILIANRAGCLLCCWFVPYATATKADRAWVGCCVSVRTANWNFAVHSQLLATLAKQIVTVFKVLVKIRITNAAFVFLQNTVLTVGL